MSKNKKKSSGAGGKGAGVSTHKQPVAKAAKSKSKAPLIIGTLVVIGIIAAIAISGNLGGGASSTAGATGAAGAASSPQPTAEEAKYIGRLLPAAYVAPKVADPWVINQQINMTPVTAQVEATGVAVAVADVTTNKLVSFSYTKPSGEVVPLLAYVRPSGKVFVGVSFCIPCKGTGQTLEADGTMRCQSCGTKRDPESLVGISGACKLYPLDELPATAVGGKLVIDKGVLDNWIAQPTDRKIGA
jgi:Membrane iron-sulfur containing protein FtrD-like